MQPMGDSNNILPTWGCNICFEESRNPVCTTCGHLFCWPCLYTWMHDMTKPCPVCRSSLTVDVNVIPVYVNTRAESSQAATPIPPRPNPARLPAPLPAALTPTRAATNSVPDHGSNMIDHHRQILENLRQDQVMERAWFAEGDGHNSRHRNLLDRSYQSIARMSRELKNLSRGHAPSSGISQASSNPEMNLERPLRTEFIGRVVNAIVGRHGSTR